MVKMVNMKNKKTITLTSTNTPPVHNGQSIIIIRTGDLLHVETDFENGLWWIFTKNGKIKVKSVHEDHVESDITAISDHIANGEFKLYLRVDSFSANL